MLDLDIVAVDGKPVDFKVNPFETIFFDNTNPTAESKRRISLKNSSPIGVMFHWSIYKEKNSNKITLGDEPCHYRVVPQQGKIKGNETIEFEIFFSPDHAEPYFEYADLIIEDVPIYALRSPQEGLIQFYNQN